MSKRTSSFRLFLQRPSGVLGLALLSFIAVMALIAGYCFPNGPTEMISRPLLWPGERPGLPFGTDRMGASILAGVMYGARASILVGLSAATASILMGTLMGAVAGYYRGWLDDVLMRITDAVQTIPSFLAAVVIVGVTGPSLTTVIISISIVSWPIIARLVRAEFLRLRNFDFVHSCRIIGMSDARIILTQILPNCLSTIVVASSVLVATAIIVEASLSFLGLGDPNVVSWGSMIGAGRSVLRAASYITLIPAGFVVATVLSINLIGDALNDVLNPRLHER